jgi:hypothetical protein
MRIAAAVVLVVVAIVAGGCGSGEPEQSAPGAPPNVRACPAAWLSGWQRIADEIQASVYCPTWMPPPLDGEVGGTYRNTTAVDADRSYLVSFLHVEREAGGIGGEVHVNFRGYPATTEIPTCEDTRTDAGKVTRVAVPCFSDPRGTKEIAGERVTVYTVNQGIDQWHVLYAWEHGGGLYTVSQHVVAPATVAQVSRDLDRVMRGLARVEAAGP